MRCEQRCYSILLYAVDYLFGESINFHFGNFVSTKQQYKCSHLQVKASYRMEIVFASFFSSVKSIFCVVKLKWFNYKSFALQAECLFVRYVLMRPFVGVKKCADHSIFLTHYCDCGTAITSKLVINAISYLCSAMDVILKSTFFSHKLIQYTILMCVVAADMQ